MARNKRKRSPSHSPDSKGTRSLQPSVISIDDDEDDLEAILLRIKHQEESDGALARKLQDEWDGAASTSKAHPQNEVIVIEDDLEDDEAMAMRLSLQWEREEKLSSRQPTLNGKPSDPSTSYIPADQDLPPDEKLLQFRDFFTADRPCTKCEKSVKSPRGHVSLRSILQAP
jgi:baculoviral IAP repeat-containing protein 6